jgi:hypothetical protein
MSGIIVHLQKMFGDVSAQVKVMPDGDFQVVYGSNFSDDLVARQLDREKNRVSGLRSRSSSQLLTIRQFELLGWTLIDTKGWEEAQV